MSRGRFGRGSWHEHPDSHIHIIHWHTINYSSKARTGKCQEGRNYSHPRKYNRGRKLYTHLRIGHDSAVTAYYNQSRPEIRDGFNCIIRLVGLKEVSYLLCAIAACAAAKMSCFPISYECLYNSLTTAVFLLYRLISVYHNYRFCPFIEVFVCARFDISPI